MNIEKKWLQRTELLVGVNNIERLQRANVLIVGLGGVGSFAAEFIGRAGVGNMTIADGDTVDTTNINRQLVALTSTVGKPKVEVMAERLLDINPALNLRMVKEFLEPERMGELVTSEYDFVLDCIDSFTPKIHLITACIYKKARFISSMGAGGVLDPSHVKVTSISKTRNCPLAQLVRKRMRRQHILRDFKVVASDEPKIDGSLCLTDGSNYKRSFYGTISYMPAIFGLNMAGYVVQQLIQKEDLPVDERKNTESSPNLAHEQ